MNLSKSASLGVRGFMAARGIGTGIQKFLVLLTFQECGPFSQEHSGLWAG